jgi:hypothetical protein
MRRHASLALLAVLPLPAMAETCSVPEGAGRTINHANLFIEDNAGDGDIGVHGYFDDHGWTEMCVFDPDGKLVLHVMPEGRMGDLGIAGVFFESREPEYAEWDLDALKAAWPEGDYTLRALGHDGELLTGAAWFTTVVPVMPKILTPASVPEPDEGVLPLVPVADLKVEWEPVTASQDGRPINIRGYQISVKKENHEDDHGFSTPFFDVHVGPHVTSLAVPAVFFDAASVYEIEVLAIEESGNQTIGGASFFATE